MAEKKSKGGAKFKSTRPLVFAPHPEHPHDPTKSKQIGPQKPDDLDDYQGKYVRKNDPEDAPTYGLKIIEESTENYGHTHFLKNEEFSWSGTLVDFKDQFEEA